MVVFVLLLFADIKDGNLKAILGLFFSLSRYKQQQKTQQSQKQGDREPSSKDPQQPPPQQQQVSILRSQCSTGSSSVAIDSDQAGSGGKAAQQLNGGEMISRLELRNLVSLGASMVQGGSWTG